jgi:predicted transcriptional regulator
MRVAALPGPSGKRAFPGTPTRRVLDLKNSPSIRIGNLAKEIIPWYSSGMKTAISIPDDVFESADELAEQMGVSRSYLYATAVAEYVAKHRASDVTATLNEVYAEEPSGVDRALRTAQARSVGSSGW